MRTYTRTQGYLNVPKTSRTSTEEGDKWKELKLYNQHKNTNESQNTRKTLHNDSSIYCRSDVLSCFAFFNFNIFKQMLVR